ncbi:hypothetical protein MMC09_006888 [Bachmanniomyces sp. S44760]|nr:hypothetical protein [Bachmanniomyces sp. S44760]
MTWKALASGGVQTEPLFPVTESKDDVPELSQSQDDIWTGWSERDPAPKTNREDEAYYEAVREEWANSESFRAYTVTMENTSRGRPSGVIRPTAPGLHSDSVTSRVQPAPSRHQSGPW